MCRMPKERGMQVTSEEDPCTYLLRSPVYKACVYLPTQHHISSYLRATANVCKVSGESMCVCVSKCACVRMCFALMGL